MNDHQIPPRAVFKGQARQIIVHAVRPVLWVSGIVLAFQLSALFFQMNFGGVLNYYIFDIADYASSTGIWVAENGVTAILRLDAAGVLLALPLSFRQIFVFFLSNLLLFLILTPLLMGALEQFQAILSNRFHSISELFRWYTNPRLAAKSIGLGAVLSGVKWIARAVCMAPGFVLFAWAADSGQESYYLTISYILLLAGAGASYWIYTLVLPARYLLARTPNVSVAQVLSGARAVRGRRTEYFLLRLSFLLWHVASSFSYGALGLFILPYTEFTNLLYLRAVIPEQGQGMPVNPRDN